jgi:hypothetical protein
MGLVEGHDFSRADRADYSRWALAPAGFVPGGEEPQIPRFLGMTNREVEGFDVSSTVQREGVCTV